MQTQSADAHTPMPVPMHMPMQTHSHRHELLGHKLRCQECRGARSFRLTQSKLSSPLAATATFHRGAEVWL